jgi:hypothetical protein
MTPSAHSAAEGSSLPPFHKKPNCKVDHDHNDYDLNHTPNRHFEALLMRPDCLTDPSSGQQAGLAEHRGKAV